MSTPTALRRPFSLTLASNGFLIFWCLLAAFPIFWIAVMSFKVPVDAFASNPLHVIFGPETRAAGKGLSVLDILAGLSAIGGAVFPDSPPATHQTIKSGSDGFFRLCFMGWH